MKKKLMVSGASYSMCNWDEVHWADQIGEAGGFKEVIYEGVPWSDFEAGAFITCGRILNDRKITHLIYTGTYTFVEHFQEEQRLTAEQLIDIDNELSVSIASSRTFYDKLRIIFNQFLPNKSNDPTVSRMGNKNWIAHRMDMKPGDGPYQGMVPDEVQLLDETSNVKPVDRYGQVFLGLDDEEFYNTPLYKKYLRTLSSITLVKHVCDARGVKCIFLPFPFTNSMMNSVLTRLPDFDIMPMWDIIPETFGSIAKWKELSVERGWVGLASHFDQWGHDEVAKAFIKNNKEFLDES
tara:strand:- start:6021 stop:6902 length:882 start_codon:yes stop_codon:yes gene_type:complete